VLKANFPILDFIAEAEEATQITLTSAAKDMLTIPVMELTEAGEDVDFEEVRESVLTLVKAMAEDDPSQPSGEYNSVVVIRAFFKRFCNIPPFCSRTNERSQSVAS
jgi:hypothetical protein